MSMKNILRFLFSPGTSLSLSLLLSILAVRKERNFTVRLNYLQLEYCLDILENFVRSLHSLRLFGISSTNFESKLRIQVVTPSHRQTILIITISRETEMTS